MSQAQELERLVIKLIGEGSDYKQVLDEAVANTEDAAEDMEEALEGVSGALTAVGGKMKEMGKSMRSWGMKASLGISLPLVLTGLGMTKAAADAEETTNKFNVVFRDVLAGAEAATQKLDEFYGLSHHQAKTMLSDTGDLLTGFGFDQQQALDVSEQLQTLAADLASFTNVSGGAKKASEALTKSLFGEYEMAKQLGVVIKSDTDEFKELYKDFKEGQDMTDNMAKAMTVLTIATNQSKNAIGDFGRSQHSLTNQTKELKADIADVSVQIGEVLIPAAQMLVTGLKKVVKWVKDMSPDTKRTIMVLLGFAAAIGPVIFGLGTIVTALGIATIAVGALGGAMKVFSTIGIVGLIVGVIAVVERLTGVLGKLGKAWNENWFGPGGMKGFTDDEYEAHVGNMMEAHTAINFHREAKAAKAAGQGEYSKWLNAQRRQAKVAGVDPTRFDLPGGEGTAMWNPESLVERVEKKLAAELAAKEAFAKKFPKIAADAAAITKTHATATEVFAAAVKNLNDHLEGGRITAETYHRAIQKASKAYQDSKVTDSMKASLKDAARITEAALTPTQKYQKEIKNLNDHLEAGRISTETYSATVTRLTKELEDLENASKITLRFETTGLEAVEAGTAEAAQRLQAHRGMQRRLREKGKVAENGTSPIAIVGTSPASRGAAKSGGVRGAVLEVLKLIEDNTRRTADNEGVVLAEAAI